MLINIIKVIIESALVVSVFGYLLNEFTRNYFQRKTIKEKKYEKLVDLIFAFDNKKSDEKNQEIFLKEYRKCWLFIPDDIIIMLNEFLLAAKNHPETANEKAQKLILSIRKKMKKTTKLCKDDFLLLNIINNK